jgi:hypothetical protein
MLGENLFLAFSMFWSLLTFPGLGLLHLQDHQESVVKVSKATPQIYSSVTIISSGRYLRNSNAGRVL